MDSRDLIPFITIILLMVGILFGLWWAFRPPSRKNQPGRYCPRCHSEKIRRTGWEKPDTGRSPWMKYSGTIRFGLKLNSQKVRYRCKDCDHKWETIEVVPDFGQQ